MINIIRPTMRFGQNHMIGYEAMFGIILKNTIANSEPFTLVITCSELKSVWPI